MLSNLFFWPISKKKKKRSFCLLGPRRLLIKCPLWIDADFSGATLQLHTDAGGIAEQTPTWQWIISLVGTSRKQVSEQPNDLAPLWLKPSARNSVMWIYTKHISWVRHEIKILLRKLRLKTLTVWKKKSPKTLPHARYSHKHLLPFQFFLLLKTREYFQVPGAAVPFKPDT